MVGRSGRTVVFALSAALALTGSTSWSATAATGPSSERLVVTVPASWNQALLPRLADYNLLSGIYYVVRTRTPIVGYLDTPQMVALLTWQQTPAGAQYVQEIAKAIRGE